MRNSKEKQVLTDILKTLRPSGNERDGLDYMADRLKLIGAHKVTFDKIGNLTSVFSLPDEFDAGYENVMLSAHLDEIGFQVLNITKEGKIAVAPLGGIDKRTLIGSKVMFENGAIGIIGADPIHVIDGKDRGKLGNMEEFLVDVGARSDIEVTRYFKVKIGDTLGYSKDNLDAYFGRKYNYIVGPGLDDGVGLYIIQKVARDIKKAGCGGRSLFVCCAAQEEVGLRGAGILAKRLNPSLSIDIDLTPEEGNPNKYGKIKMGKGVVIEFGPSKSKYLGQRLIELAKKHKIPYQTCVGTACNTNTAIIQEMSWNCETTLLSIPSRNLHTQVEMCCWSDIEACIKLLTKFLNGE